MPHLPRPGLGAGPGPLWRWFARLMLALALWPGLAGAALAQELQPVPALAARVTDTTGTLSAKQREAIDAKLAAFEREAGTQIVVLVVATTQPEDIAAYAYRVADQWKVGRREVGDGLLVLVAKDDRRVRIEVAKALEGAVPDLAAKQIIDNAIRPAFKAGDYAGGLNAAIDQLAARVRGEALPAPDAKARRAPSSGGFGGVGWDQLALFFFIGVPIIGSVLTGLFGRKLGGLVTGGAAGGLAWLFGAPMLLAGVAGAVALVLVGVLGIGSAARRGVGLRGGHGTPVIWGGGGGGSSWGGGGGGGGGGGFSSGGGGDFGGGGASGDW
ncbi:YgcG family protein [Ideonella sp.]|uniref:TPM domain-containing protein n=1 Tax=Ideonella sp. TaxID=1929293 RepID=UPI0035AE1161